MTQDEQRIRALEDLDRFFHDEEYKCMSQDDDGDYVRLNDVKKFLSSPVAQAENTTGLCVKILDTRPNKPFGTWQVIEVLEAIKGFGLIIVEKKDV